MADNRTRTRNRVKRIMEAVVPGFILQPLLTQRMKQKYRVYAGRSAEDVFTDIHDNNRWRGRQSVSGQGSDLEQTKTIRELLPKLVAEMGITSILDVPCGDFNWMQHVDLGPCQYVGGDIVASLAAKCQELYGSPTRRFIHLDITKDDLPKTDMILCRDCFIHLPIELIRLAIGNFKRCGAKYLFTTNGPNKKVNVDIITGGYRLPNLRLPPFNFPPPIRTMRDDAPSQLLAENPDFDRYMELWELSQIPD
jgi:SAM-dependent methyltransferase